MIIKMNQHLIFVYVRGDLIFLDAALTQRILSQSFKKFIKVTINVAYKLIPVRVIGKFGSELAYGKHFAIFQLMAFGLVL